MHGHSEIHTKSSFMSPNFPLNSLCLFFCSLFEKWEKKSSKNEWRERKLLHNEKYWSWCQEFHHNQNKTFLWVFHHFRLKIYLFKWRVYTDIHYYSRVNLYIYLLIVPLYFFSTDFHLTHKIFINSIFPVGIYSIYYNVYHTVLLISNWGIQKNDIIQLV